MSGRGWFTAAPGRTRAVARARGRADCGLGPHRADRVSSRSGRARDRRRVARSSGAGTATSSRRTRASSSWRPLERARLHSRGERCVRGSGRRPASSSATPLAVASLRCAYTSNWTHGSGPAHVRAGQVGSSSTAESSSPQAPRGDATGHGPELLLRIRARGIATSLAPSTRRGPWRGARHRARSRARA